MHNQVFNHKSMHNTTAMVKPWQPLPVGLFLCHSKESHTFARQVRHKHIWFVCVHVGRHCSTRQDSWGHLVITYLHDAMQL